MTRETLNKMPEVVRNRLERLRKDYNNPSLNYDTAREASAAYVMGLKDAGLVTERERQILFVYTTGSVVPTLPLNLK